MTFQEKITQVVFSKLTKFHCIIIFAFSDTGQCKHHDWDDIDKVGILYFGKKEMSLHCDIFVKKNKNVLVKSVYLTTMYRCDQDMIATLRIADMVLKEHIFH